MPSPTSTHIRPQKLPAWSAKQIYALVRKIPLGKVATYGQIAKLAGMGARSRLVGHMLSQLEDPPTKTPWHRVVNAQGEISYSLSRAGGDDWQRVLLEQEGVTFTAAGKINLKKYLWQPQNGPTRKTSR